MNYEVAKHKMYDQAVNNNQAFRDNDRDAKFRQNFVVIVPSEYRSYAEAIYNWQEKNKSYLQEIKRYSSFKLIYVMQPLDNNYIWSFEQHEFARLIKCD